MPEYRNVTRVNSAGTNAVLNYAVCKPYNLDLAWSPTAATLPSIMSSYGYPYQRASNCNYLIPKTGEPLGYVMKDRAVLRAATDADKKYDGWWIDYNVYEHFEDPGAGDFLPLVALDRLWLGMNNGPLLVYAGTKTNLAQEISEAGYSGLAESSSLYVNGDPILRVGFGWISTLDLIVHVICTSGGFSLYNLQNFFTEFPGISCALAFDGGHCAGTLDNEAGTLGSTTQIMQVAFVMRDKEPIPSGFPV